jgi:hypothetical protein
LRTCGRAATSTVVVDVEVIDLSGNAGARGRE